MEQTTFAYTPTQTPIRIALGSPGKIGSGSGGPGGSGEEEVKLTRKQAVLNIFNCSVGVGLLAKPYAFAVGGWIAIPALCAACGLCVYTALLIGAITEKYVEYRADRHMMRYNGEITSSNSEQQRLNNNNRNSTVPAHLKRVHSTKAFDAEDNSAAYPLIAKFSIGRSGKPLAIIAIYLMLVTLFCVAIVTTWTLVIELIEPLVALLSSNNTNNNESTAGGINETILFFIVCIISLPTSLALSWNELTGLAYLSIMSVAAIAASVVGLMIYCLIEFDLQPPYMYYNWTFESISMNSGSSSSSSVTQGNTASRLDNKQPFSVLVSFALFVMGISSHVALPMIHMNLENKKEWKSVVFIAFGLIGGFYMAIGAIGFWLFGEFTSIIILSNFFYWPGGVLPVIVSILVILNLWSSFGIVVCTVQIAHTSF